MSKILVLAKSGFGKTTSYCGRDKLGIKGLNPKETYIIQCIGRGVSNPNFKLIEGKVEIIKNRDSYELADKKYLEPETEFK